MKLKCDVAYIILTTERYENRDKITSQTSNLSQGHIYEDEILITNTIFRYYIAK